MLPKHLYTHDRFTKPCERHGAQASGALIFDSAGTLYGTPSAGGTHNGGTAFKITP